MRTTDGAHALPKLFDDDALDVEVVEAEGGGNDVDDRVDGTDLVEVDLVGRGAVGLRLRLGDDAEGVLGEVTRTPREVCGLEEREHVGERAVLVVVMVLVIMVMLMLVMVREGVGGAFGMQPGHVVVVGLVLLVEDDIEVAGVDAVLADAADSHLKGAKTCALEAREDRTQAKLAGAKVQERGDEHVPRDAGRAVEKKRGGHGYSPSESFVWLGRPTWLMRCA